MSIYVWGIGCGASELLEQGLEIQRVTAFVDSFPYEGSFLGKQVLRPEELQITAEDLLIITTRHTEAVEETCRRLEISESSCLYLKNSSALLDRNARCTAAEKYLDKELLARLLPQQRVVTVPHALQESDLPKEEAGNDYVRMATLELLCRRLDTVPGAAAELGVYRGHFARCINRLLPRRTLYLFDSFAGFAEGTGASDAFQAAHTNVTMEKVRALLPYPEQVVIKPGYFPRSLEGLEERFCLVSLDVDFGEATLEGLRYFWPRLSEGGYLLLHDWGSPKLPEVAWALAQYELELGERLPAVPICDLSGSLILCK